MFVSLSPSLCLFLSLSVSLCNSILGVLVEVLLVDIAVVVVSTGDAGVSNGVRLSTGARSREIRITGRRNASEELGLCRCRAKMKGTRNATIEKANDLSLIHI